MKNNKPRNITKYLAALALSPVLFAGGLAAQTTMDVKTKETAKPKITYHSQGAIDTDGFAYQGDTSKKIALEASAWLRVAGDDCKIMIDDMKPMDGNPDRVSDSCIDMRLFGDKCEEKYGQKFRTTRDNLIQKYVDKYTAMIKAGEGTVNVEQHPVEFGGNIQVWATHPDGTEFYVKDWEGDGSTEYFIVTELDKSEPVRMRNDLSETAKKYIENLADFTVKNYQPKEESVWDKISLSDLFLGTAYAEEPKKYDKERARSSVDALAKVTGNYNVAKSKATLIMDAYNTELKFGMSKKETVSEDGTKKTEYHSQGFLLPQEKCLGVPFLYKKQKRSTAKNWKKQLNPNQD